jgi:hypothetical protein
VVDAAALVLAVAAFGSLALSMHKHHCNLFGAPPSHARAVAFRAIGWTLLAGSITPCVAASGWSVGTVLWFGLLTIAALVVALLLAYQRRLIEREPNRVTTT